jgi:hypothetical protein
MTNLMRDDEGQIRLLGSKTFISSAIERLGAAVDVSYDGNLRANRYGDGHRAHANIRLTEPAADGRPSPRQAAEQAKDHRDLAAELAILTAADSDLRSQPWFPIQVGDVVCWSIDLPDGRHGETLVAVDEPNWSTEAGAPLRKVSATRLEQDSRWEYEDFYDIWFEAGPSKIAIIRHGQLVHGTVPAMNGGAR